MSLRSSLCCLLLASCSVRGGLEVEVTAAAAIENIDHFRVQVTDSHGHTTTTLVPLSNPPHVPPTQSFALSFPSGFSDTVTVALAAETRDEQTLAIAPSAMVAIQPGHLASLYLALGTPAADMTAIADAGVHDLAAPPDQSADTDLSTPVLPAPDLFTPDLFVPDLFTPDLFTPDLPSPTPGIQVTASTLTTSVSGSIVATFSVVLTSAPASDVEIDMTSSDTNRGTLSTASLTFGVGNWATPQTVTITGGAAVGSYAIDFAASVSNDSNYRGLVANPLAVTNVGSIAFFTSVGTTSWTVPAGVTQVNVLVVAGGGSGGNYVGGGGGAGGVIYQTGVAVSPGAQITVTVGAGGPGVTAPVNGADGIDGDNSVFGSLVAIGGGGGGNAYLSPGLNGGSGGGGSSPGPGGSATSGQGYAGGVGGGNGAGGGGGAGGVGPTANSNGISGGGGNGGPGLPFEISGTLMYYGGGGGGSGQAGQGTGGIGGGGNAGALGSPVAASGLANTGGGGGGDEDNTSQPSGAGGSGVVIISY